MILSIALALTLTSNPPQIDTKSVAAHMECRAFVTLSAESKHAVIQAYMVGVALGGYSVGGNIMHFLKLAPGREEPGKVTRMVDVACQALPDNSIPAIVRAIAEASTRANTLQQ